MTLTVLSRSAAVAAAVAVVATGCGGSGSEPATSTSAETTSVETTSPETTATTTTSATAAPSTARIAPRKEAPKGPAPTIADYIADNDIQEFPVHVGDPGAPEIDLPMPEGWQPAGEDTPEWAYGAIYYDGPGAEEYTPSVVALVSRLVGNVDPQAVLDHAAGELTNLPGWTPLGEGGESTLGEYPAYQLAGNWNQDGVAKVVAQKTVVIPGRDGLYVLQLNADGLESQSDIVAEATNVIDDETVITP
ncbi:LpqN/LpqT family lipoprotein [Mycolicibacterium sp.]|uniref:LpqN/LpqT family lipoprotein n=1 Tax=Mycolicibacterium sp. TaxID=2320850 RepID=UPI003D100535